jgi:hypothetical protein
MEYFGIFYDIWSVLRPFLYILWPFGIYCGNSVYFLMFWYVVQIKIWQPWRTYEREEPLDKKYLKFSQLFGFVFNLSLLGSAYLYKLRLTLHRF